MGLKRDFHIHTTYSDGSMKPLEIVKKFQKEEYGTIAITDHDGVDGVTEAKIAGETIGLEVISGIELGTTYSKDDIELHILGYYIDIENQELLKELDKLKSNRMERNNRLLKLLNSMGYEISEDDLKQRPGQTYIGKPNFALALAKKGYVENPSQAFEKGRFLDSPEVEEIKKEKITTERAIDLIRGAGGLPVLAHPLKIKKIGEKASPEFMEHLSNILRDLKKKGLKGLECFHPSASYSQSVELVKLAEKYHLHITEGSDYHGPEFE